MSSVLSRALAKTLRHQAKAQGIPQDPQGWCLVTDLLSHDRYKSLKATEQSIFDVVAADQKGRYELSEDKLKIRAVQGHSVNVDVGLEEIKTAADLPPLIVHGTYANVWPQIKTTGLNKMKRLHIHLATQLPNHSTGQIISGMRNSAEVLIYIDGPKALAAGVPFFKSKNNAILSPGINGVIKPEFFSKVTDRKDVDLF